MRNRSSATRRVQIFWTGFVCLALSATISADTLVMRDGRRVQGQLIAVRDGTIEFEGQKGFFGRERLRIDRDEVARIELDENRSDSTSSSGGVSQGRPSGLREREVSVSASAAWTDTGINVPAGRDIYLNATGRVRWGPNRQDGPGGERSSPRNDARPIPSRPAASLIGRIGDGNDVFFIGAEGGPIRMRAEGRLYLGINDDMLGDNSGAFRVTVYY
jgi:PA-IL-like protein